MATLVSIIGRVRLEISDQATPFISNATGDGFTTVYDLPHAPVSTLGLSVMVDDNPVGSYSLDEQNGAIVFDLPPAAGAAIQVNGLGYRFFTDAELGYFVDNALKQHLHNRGLTLATLPPVEDYLVTLLASIEALYALLNDAAYDINVNTPEGVSVPRNQRFQQLMEMIQLREKQYKELSEALNVGLSRVEQFTLRRVSRKTGRLVPVYKPREIEDSRPPERVFLPIDTQGGTDVPNAVEPVTLDVSTRQGNTLEIPLQLGFDLTGWTGYAYVRRYPGSARLREFTVTVTDAPAGELTLSLTANDTRVLPRQLFWSLDLRDPSGNEETYYLGRLEVDRNRLANMQTLR